MKRGAPLTLLEKAAGAIEPPLLGVGARFGCLRNGDSGRASDGLVLGLKRGLGALAPGPTDCENFGMAAVGGVYPLLGETPLPWTL